MPLFNKLVDVSPGDTILASVRNAEFDNIIDNLIPSMIEDASANVTQMRVTADPGTTGAENLPTTLQGEIQQLRFAIDAFHAGTNWYDVPAVPLAIGAGTTTDNAIARYDGTSSTLQNSGITIDDEDNMTIVQKEITTSGAGTTFTDTTVTDSATWDLSAVAVDHVAVASGGSKGIITAVNDAGNVITVADWIPSNPTDSETVTIKAGGTLSVPNFGVVPIGSIIDFWNAGNTLTLPDNFVKCDGQTIADAESPLNGVTLPDLNTSDGVYTIGTDSASHDTSIDGDTNHSVSIGNHSHTIPNHSHNIDANDAAALLGYDDEGDVILLEGRYTSYGAWPGSGNRGFNTEGTDNDASAVTTSELASNSASVEVRGNTATGGGGSTGSGGSHSVNIKGASLPVWKVMRIK